MLFYLIISGTFSLASFAAALIFYDQWRKERVISIRLERCATVSLEQSAKLRELAAHWCNEAIQNERKLVAECIERKRWERAYSSELPARFN